MSGLPWNIPGPFVCHCDSCDAKPEPACDVCGGDGIEIDEWGLCPECRPTDEETCEAWEARAATRRAK